jgi:hypothetical protein
MSVIGSNILAGASGQGGAYNLERSLRFRSSASAYLNRTPASASNRKTWTWSGWVKRGVLGTDQVFMSSDVGTSVNTWMEFGFNSSNQLYVSSYTGQRFTAAVFRDPSAWYHVVVALDTTQATEDDRLKFYVNGVLQSDSGDAFPALNTDYGINNNQIHDIGRRNWASGIGRYFNGYMTEVNFIDGQALTPSSFGANNASTGVWQPKKYAGTYGTNGFYLPFSDNASTTTLGSDFSGNGNNWTTNNISLTAGSTYDSMTDVPTLTSATAANFAVFNPLASAGTFSNANLNLAVGSGGESSGLATMALPSTGKYYWEVLVTAVGSDYLIGIYDGSNTTNPTSGGSFYFYRNTGQKQQSGSTTSYGSSYTTNDIIGIALDMDGGTITFYKNNTSQGVAFSGISGSNFKPTTYLYNNASAAINFGQRPFAYTPPTGFVALNTFNLPTPTIGATASTQAGKFMNTVTYTGNGASSRAITGVGFQPDLVWTKSRSGANPNVWIDSNRGLSKFLISNSSNAEGTDATLITSFDSDGFTIGTDNPDYNNFNGDTYVAWNWRANQGTNVSNTAGSITSTVSANTSAGFSVVTYTGNGTAGATVGHGLGVAPKMIIVKNRGNSSPNWVVYHESLGTTGDSYLGYPEYYLLQLADTSGKYDFSQDTIYDSNSNTFRIGSSGVMTQVNASSATYVAYCFSEVAGYSKFGSYTGNGSSDGTFNFTGFRPALIMLKRTDSTGNWTIYDSTRSPYNADTKVLYPNLSNAEDASTDHFDWLSNGFKMRSTNQNASGGSYIYMAFAKAPTKFSLSV